MESDETVRESCLERRSDGVAFSAWLALVAALGRGWSSAIAASAAFLFRVEGGVVKGGAADCRRRGIRDAASLGKWRAGENHRSERGGVGKGLRSGGSLYSLTHSILSTVCWGFGRSQGRM